MKAALGLVLAGALLLMAGLACAADPASDRAPGSATGTETAGRGRLDLSRLNRRKSELGQAGLFSSNSLFPPPPVDTTPAVPAAPELPFVFLGRIVQGASETVLLAINTRSFKARVGDVLDDTYLVSRIEKDKVVFVYLPLSTEQVLNVPHGE
jgi:hypothetical protein